MSRNKNSKTFIMDAGSGPSKIDTLKDIYSISGGENWSASLADYTTVKGQLTIQGRTLDTSSSVVSGSTQSITINGDNGYISTIPFERYSSGGYINTSTITISSGPLINPVTINPGSGGVEWTLTPRIDGTWDIGPRENKRPDEEEWSGNINPESKSIKTIDVFVDHEELKLGVVDQDGKAVLINLDRSELNKLISLLQSALIKTDGWRDYYKSLDGKENISPLKDEQPPLDQEVY